MAEHGTSAASSTGQVFTTGDWLDTHFEMARPEYVAMAESAGFQPGWRVLDAGCGSGSFLPVLAKIVGPPGKLVALDVASENVDIIRQRVASWQLPCPVEAEVGSVLDLLYPDDSFDGLWCSAVVQYLRDDELTGALTEFRRVVREGGLIAIKDIDGTTMRMPTREPSLLNHLREARARAGSIQAQGAMRGPALRAFLRAAGLTNIRVRTTMVERWAPYRPIERQYIQSGIEAFAGMAEEVDIPQSERTEWARLLAERDSLLSDPDHYYREGHVLAVGSVPTG